MSCCETPIFFTARHAYLHILYASRYTKSLRFPRKYHGSETIPSATQLAQFLRVVEILHNTLVEDVVVTKR